MALTAAQFVRKKDVVLGPGSRLRIGTFTGPASYASGGEDLTRAIAKAAFGMNEIHALHFTPLTNPAVANIAFLTTFDHASTATSQGKIHTTVAAGTETTTTTDLSTYTCKYFAWGN